jgi:hypothetical protein
VSPIRQRNPASFAVLIDVVPVTGRFPDPPSRVGERVLPEIGKKGNTDEANR